MAKFYSPENPGETDKIVFLQTKKLDQTLLSLKYLYVRVNKP